MIDIVEQVNLFKEKAKQLLMMEGNVAPVVFGFLASGAIIVAEMSFETYEEKQAKFSALKKLLKEKGATACVTVFEAWYLPKEKIRNNRDMVPPSEHPEREEAILVEGKIPGRSYSVIIPFARNNGKIEFKEEIVGDTDEGHSVEDNLLKGLFAEVH